MAYKNAKSAAGLGRVAITLIGTPPSGASVTMAKDGSSETKVISASGTVTFNFKDGGTCLLNASEGIYGLPNSMTLVKGGQYELSAYAGTDDFEIWVEIGGLEPSDYASLAALCADAVAMETLMNTAAAVDYMIDSTEVIMPAVVASETAFTALDASSYALNSAMDSAAWWTAISASSACVAIMDASALKVPAMTSNTTPSGVASASSSYTGNNPPGWVAYNTFRGGAWLAQGGTYTQAQWIQYEFPQPIKGYKYSVGQTTSGYYEIQAWVDGAWVQCAQKKYTDSASATSMYQPAYSQCFSTPIISAKYRLYSHYANCNGSNGSSHHVEMLQFYGKEAAS